MMKHSALPPGVNPSLGRKRLVTGVTSSALLDKEVLIEDMTLPEFSSNTRISGPICAIIMDNAESSYDIIISMDLMQTLGIDIHNSSKTVVWGQLRVPVKPHDYFSSNLFQTALQDQMVSSFDEHNADDELGYKSKTIKHSLYEQNCINILNHVSVTRIVIHIPFPREGSIPHLGLNPQSDPLKP
jgi:hypothetical protein